MKPDDLLKLIAVVGIFILMAGCLAAIVLVKIPESQLNLFTAIASGGVTGALGIVVGFLFGSSLGSRNKDAALIENQSPPG